MYKVLVIAYYFPPLGLSGVQRTLKFCKYMKDYDWEPTVITVGKTGYYAHDNSMLDEAEKALIRIERTEGNDVNSLLSKFGTIKMPSEFIRKFLSLISKTFFIPDNKKSWSKKAYLRAKEILAEEKYDLIYISIPPFSAFNSCLKLGEEFRIPVFVDYRDLWFSNQFRFHPTPYHKIRHKKMEEALVRKVDKILVTNRFAKEQMLADYAFLDFDDISIVPHGFDTEDFENVAIDRENTDKLVIGYSGIFYETVTPKYFLLAFKMLTNKRPDIAAKIELHFIGDLRKKNRRLVNKLGLHEYVHELGYMNHKEAVKKLMNCDVLWVMLGNNKNSFHVAPGKLFEYFASRKPIIACAQEGAITRNSIDYGASIVTEPDNIDQIMYAIIKMYDDHTNGTLPVPNEEFIKRHDRKYIAQQILKDFQFYIRED